MAYSKYDASGHLRLQGCPGTSVVCQRTKGTGMEVEALIAVGKPDRPSTIYSLSLHYEHLVLQNTSNAKLQHTFEKAEPTLSAFGFYVDKHAILRDGVMKGIPVRVFGGRINVLEAIIL